MPHPDTATQPTPEHILQVGVGFWSSKTLLSAIELGVFTALGEGPKSIADLQSKLGLHARSSRDFLDALVSMAFLNREGDTYSNTPATDLYLDKNKPSYIGGILEMCNRRLYPFWGHLTEALVTGSPRTKLATVQPHYSKRCMLTRRG